MISSFMSRKALIVCYFRFNFEDLHALQKSVHIILSDTDGDLNCVLLLLQFLEVMVSKPWPREIETKVRHN